MECRVMFTTGPGKWFISPDMIDEMSYQSHRRSLLFVIISVQILLKRSGHAKFALN